MDQKLLQVAAETLRAALDRYAPIDRDVALLREALRGCIDKALSGAMLQPERWQSIPGDRFFDETEIRKLGDLERAYAHFKIQATGGEPPALLALKAKMGETSAP